MNQDPVAPIAFEAKKPPFVLAALGAWFASGYWALLTLLIALGAMAGAGSMAQLVLPCVLVGLYAVRGTQLFKGDATAASKILWLHGVGGAVALFQMTRSDGFIVFLQGLKVAIHVFGGITAFMVHKVHNENLQRSAQQVSVFE